MHPPATVVYDFCFLAVEATRAKCSTVAAAVWVSELEPMLLRERRHSSSRHSQVICRSNQKLQPSHSRRN